MGRAFICGRCGTRGYLPRAIRRAEIQCASCNAILELDHSGEKPRSLLGTIVRVVVAVALVGGLGAAVIFGREQIAGAVQQAGKTAGVVIVTGHEAMPTSPEEIAIRGSGTRDRIVAAIDPSSPTTRNLAARVASADSGPFHVGQVASIWAHVRGEWQYVNDPRGNEYFATASESIENEFAGDCDDYSIVLVSMIQAIGGDARVVMSDGEAGGHAYAEVCVPGEPEEVIAALRTHYRRARPRRTIRSVHFRRDPTCGLWLNLDWSAQQPGGPYSREAWAVAIYPEGKTETLAPGAPP